MIKVEIKKEEITVSGHAKYADVGKDIVCASVSSVIYTTVNGILNIDKSAIKVTDEDELLKIKILCSNTVVSILLDNMIALLENLESQYPKNIKIIKEN